MILAGTFMSYSLWVVVTMSPSAVFWVLSMSILVPFRVCLAMVAVMPALTLPFCIL